MLCVSCIERVAGDSSSYARQVHSILGRHKHYWPATISEAYGVVAALKRDVAAGLLVSMRELVHADMFAHLVEASEYLLDEGYKDPAD